MPFSRFLLAALSAVLFLPAAASAANTWQVAPPAFGDAAPVSSLPTVVGGGDGATWALWLTIEQRAGVSGSVVVAQRAAPDGTRGPLLRLGTTRAVPTGVLNEEPGSARFSLVPTPTGVAA
ncbi:MAG: hypothetical protein Q7T55_22025, partial [Solirubrobacteraceae bacterium]|nr:hypothetical protein [Solirubrobacteraceae bacterium]